MKITCSKAATYLINYIKAYREYYNKMIANGYPEIIESPYLQSKEIFFLIAKDGVVIADYSNQPQNGWEIAGGPAIMVDYKDSNVPLSIIEFLKSEGLYGKPIGIYKVVSEYELPRSVWTGTLPDSTDSHDSQYDDVKINVYKYALSLEKLIERLTFGAFNSILDIKLPDKNSDFWNPHIIKKLGFLPADRNNKRFFNYLELIRHNENSAWDIRSIRVRVEHDIRRDYALSFDNSNGGSLSFNYEEQLKPYYDRLHSLKKTIDEFEKLLNEEEDANEEVFHDYLKKNPLLLDLYGEALSKPRFYNPSMADSPLGKKYVEPDFIIKYPLNQYRLVELEKPGKKIATKQGQPRSEVSQSVFQIAEWKAYIKNHYNLLEEKYPSIIFNYSSTVVIGRTTEESYGAGRDIRKYKEYLKEQYSVDEIITYDDLIIKAKSAYQQLISLI